MTFAPAILKYEFSITFIKLVASVRHGCKRLARRLQRSYA